MDPTCRPHSIVLRVTSNLRPRFAQQTPLHQQLREQHRQILQWLHTHRSLHSTADTPCTQSGCKVHFMVGQPDPTKCAGNHWLDVTAPREPQIKSLPACAHAKSPSPLNKFSFDIISRPVSLCTVLFCSSMYLCKSLGHGACAVRAWACLQCLSSYICCTKGVAGPMCTCCLCTCLFRLSSHKDTWSHRGSI